MTDLSGSLLREVARVQHDKTIQAVRDMLDEIKVTTTKKNNGYGFDKEEEKSARDYKAQVLTRLRQMRDDAL